MTDVPIEREMIRLGELLKLSGVIDTGGEAKMAILAGAVMVNGEVELRRGRQLHPGDTVTFNGASLRVI